MRAIRSRLSIRNGSHPAIKIGVLLTLLAVAATIVAPATPAAATASFVISTVAGTGASGYSGDGSAATSAQLDGPGNVALDSAGNIYIADYLNNRIRKVSTGGIISTVAGTGVNGFSGDGGAATSAKLGGPNGVTIDSSDTLYIADSNNNRIRKVTTGGIISTVAGTGSAGFAGDGGMATSAQINAPLAVVADLSGNLFITDNGNSRIRKVTAGGIISTVAGTGVNGFSGDGGAATSAQLNGVTDVRIDATGAIYIADTDNQRIRKVSTGGVISTVAGTATNGFSGDGGAATSAQLSGPNAIYLDSAGNLYIADYGNKRVRMVTPGGTISTVAGTGSPGYSGDGGAATAAQLYGPDGVTVDSAGNLYVSDFDGANVRKIALVAPATNNTALNVTVDPVLSLSVTGYNSGTCNGATVNATSSTSGAVPFGHANAATNLIAGQTLSVSSNAGSGYTVYVRDTGLLSDGNGHTIADWSGSNGSPTTFPAPGTAAFGYTTDHTLSGSATRFQSNKWAAITSANAEVVFQPAPYSADVGHVCFQEGLSSATAAGNYSTTVIYTAVALF